MSERDYIGEENAVPIVDGDIPPERGLWARKQVMRSLADIVVLPEGRISGNERSLAGDILLQLLSIVEPTDRLTLAKRLAKVADIPPPLLRALILDEPDIAGALLEVKETIPEPLLIEAAQKGETAHRRMIAKRQDLTSVVIDALVPFKEIDVLKTLLTRTDRKLSPRSVDVLVAVSATKPALQPLLLRRRELEPAHGFFMFWWMDAENRRRLMARFSLDRRIIQDALGDLFPKILRHQKTSDPVVVDILLMCERRLRPRRVSGDRASMTEVIASLRAARQELTLENIEDVAALGAITPELAGRILKDPSGEPFAVLCKAVSVSRDDFYALFEVESETSAPSADADRLLEFFDAMARDYTRAVLRYWNWDSNPRISVITELMDLQRDWGQSSVV